MSTYTRGPLTVRVSDKAPFDIETTDANGELVFSRRLPCHSTTHSNAHEAISGHGMPAEWNAAELNARALADEVLRAAAPDLLEAATRAKALLSALGLGSSDEFSELSAAIAKATGETA